MKLTKAKHDEKQKNNYKKYEDAAKIVKSFERILWSDKLSGNNRKLMTGTAFWFYVCAVYFPRNLIYKVNVDHNIDEKID